MNRVFYDYLGLWRLVRLICGSKAGDEILYFNASGCARFFIGLFSLHRRFTYLDFSMSEMKDEDGTACFLKINSDLMNLRDLIMDNMIRKNGFVLAFAKMFEKEKTLLYFRKKTVVDIDRIVAYLDIAAWHCGTQKDRQSGENEFYAEKTLYSGILADFAERELFIKMIPYFSFRRAFRDLYYFVESLCRLFAKCSIVVLNGLIRLRPAAKKDTHPPRPPIVAISHAGIGISFELTERCEFPWLFFSSIPYERVFVYFRRPDICVTDRHVLLLKDRSLNFMSERPSAVTPKDVPVFSPTLFGIKTLLFYLARLAGLCAKEIAGFRFSFLAYLPNAYSFVVNYSKALDLFVSKRVSVYVDRENYVPERIAEHAAIKAAGGIGISYQFSNWPLAINSIGSGADIMFLFGPYYLPVYLRSAPSANRILFSGYMNDYSFQAVKDRSKALRNKLAENGAKFIVCYFDENSSGDRGALIPHKKSEYIYTTFLKWVISDRSVGLICSPKRPGDLLDRIPKIKALFETAKNTGRCVFMEYDYRTICYPTEPAQASDLVITLLAGGTAAMESYLSGTRTVYLDLENLYSFPEYGLGRDKIVFDSMERLMSAIGGFRRGEKDFADLGNRDLVPSLDEKDRFQDGKAAERVGKYISWLLEKTDQGYSREESIDYATRQYTEAWGKDSAFNPKESGVRSRWVYQKTYSSHPAI